MTFKKGEWNPMHDEIFKKKACLKLKGRKAWNKGLTKETDRRVYNCTEKSKLAYIEEIRLIQSQSLKLTWKENKNNIREKLEKLNNYNKSQQGRLEKKQENNNSERIKFNKEHFLGDKNPMKRNEVKKKIRLFMINYVRENCGNILPVIGKNEKQILDKLEIQYGYKILRQYEIEGYFLDGYILELNLAIEIDEDFHENQKERDIQRQATIEKALNCTFLRIKDNQFDFNHIEIPQVTLQKIQKSQQNGI